MVYSLYSREIQTGDDNKTLIINPLIIFTLYSNFRESGIEETLPETGSGI